MPIDSQPRISICIPVYNGAKYLEQCLDSVLSQTFSDFEVLIVDDKSSDESFSIAQKYAAADSRFRLVRNEQNLGLVGNWNKCVTLAQGEWIKYLFQDDIFEPKCLEKLYAVTDLGCSFIVCRRNFIFENPTYELKKVYDYFMHEGFIESIFRGTTKILAKQFCEASLDRIGDNFIGEPTSVMLHRSAFERFGAFNDKLIQLCDLEYWLRVAIHTGVVFVPETLVQFRVHEGGATAINSEKNNFHKTLLDKLILLHEIVYNPLFEPIRTVAATCEPPINLKQKLVDMVLNIRRVVERAASDPNSSNIGCYDEWKKFIKHYPQIAKIKKIPLSRTYYALICKVKSILEQKV